jgi:hypothetical protein
MWQPSSLPDSSQTWGNSSRRHSCYLGCYNQVEALKLFSLPLPPTYIYLQVTCYMLVPTPLTFPILGFCWASAPSCIRLHFSIYIMQHTTVRCTCTRKYYFMQITYRLSTVSYMLRSVSYVLRTTYVHTNPVSGPGPGSKLDRRLGPAQKKFRSTNLANVNTLSL